MLGQWPAPVARMAAAGIPGFVHELGRAAFDVDTDDELGTEDFVQRLLGTDTVRPG